MSDERYLVTMKGHADSKPTQHILSVERPKNVQDIEEARAHGDLARMRSTMLQKNVRPTRC